MDTEVLITDNSLSDVNLDVSIAMAVVVASSDDHFKPWIHSPLPTMQVQVAHLVS